MRLEYSMDFEYLGPVEGREMKLEGSKDLILSENWYKVVKCIRL